MKTYLIRFAVFLVSLHGFSGFAKDENAKSDILLKPSGKLVFKSENQTFSPMCASRREWWELVDWRDNSVQEKINRHIRKALTVGKKLKSDDCTASEKWEYYNYATVTQVHPSYIVLQTVINFPGGSGRHVADCELIDLSNGKRVYLEDHLKKEAFSNIVELAESKNVPLGEDESSALKNHQHASLVCIRDRERSLSVTTRSANSINDGFELTRQEVLKLLKPRSPLAKIFE